MAYKHRWAQPHRAALVLWAWFAVCLIGSGACTATHTEGEPTTDGIAGHGLGSFAFSGADDVLEHPIRVRYIAPHGNLATAEILFVIPGAQRDAEAYRSDWVPLVKDRSVLVIVPEFGEDDYPDSAYNLGNLMDDNHDPRPPEEWTFSVIEALFDQVVADIHSHEKGFDMYGHSAGAQFVHRFIEFTGGDRVRTAVAANAGWYTFPDDSEDFPYGLDDSPLQQDDMGPAFASNLVILLGADDIDSDDDLLRHDDESDDQGENRLERGLSFYLAARSTAEDESLSFNWRLQVVPGVGHDHTAMAKAAASLLLDVNTGHHHTGPPADSPNS